MTRKPLADKRKNELLYDLEDYIKTMKPDFDLVGDGDIERISSILGQSQNSNIIYAGKSGLGKTATIHGIAKRKLDTIGGTLAEGETRLPLHMIDRQFLVLDVNTLFEENDPEKIQQDIRRIFSELEKPGSHVLIIEDANDWLKGIEDNQCQGLISTFVRELKKGAFQSILMVRDEPGKNNLAQVMGCHSEMAELFTILEKKPPGKDNVLEIMKRSKDALERHHDGLHITDEANEQIVNLTFLYPNLRIYMREQPSRSLRMRDQIASTYVTRMQSRPKELNDLEERLENIREKLEIDPENATLKADQASAQEKIDFVNEAWELRARALGTAYLNKRKSEKDVSEIEDDIAAQINVLREKLAAEKGREPTEGEINTLKTLDIKEAEKFLREAKKNVETYNEEAKKLKNENNDQITLNISDVRGLFGEISGIPAKDLNKNEATKALGLDIRLKDKVYGQDDAIDTISGTVKRAKAGLNDPQKPIGSFMIFGSSGLGKSYVGECLAEEEYDDKAALTVFDMSEFMEKHTVSRLIGAPPGYAGYGEGGALTNAVRARPYQVILLDEVEKAHPDVFKILLQVLDKGRLSDELGTVDFRNTMILMTTNLGQHMSFDAHRTSENSEADIKSEARKIFPQELINRVDGFILMKAHTPENIQRIVTREIATLNKRMAARDITVELPKEDVVALVGDKYKPEEGARQVVKFLGSKLGNQIADIVLENSQGGSGGAIAARYDSDNDKFSLSYTKRDSGLIVAEAPALASIPANDRAAGSAPGAAMLAAGSPGAFRPTILRAAFAPAMI